MNHVWSRAKRLRNLARHRAVREADQARDLGNPARAAALYDAIIERWGVRFGILMQLGNALKDSKDFDRAEQVYNAALRLDPPNADCHLQLGHLMKLSGHLDRAVDYYTEAKRLNPSLEGAIVELRTIETGKHVVVEEAEQAATLDSSNESASPALSSPAPPAVDRHSRTFIVHQRLLNGLVWRRS